MATEAKIRITAEDATKSAFASAQSGLNKLNSSLSIFGAGLTAASVVAFVKNTLSAAAALDDMSESTGATVENLSRLSNIAQISGIEIGVVETGLVRLTKALSGADDETKGAAEAFAAIGLKVSDLKKADPAKALEEVALALNAFEDGAGKTSVALAIFGKQGAALLPLLKDIANNLNTVGTITTEQAAAAEKLGKEWNRLALTAKTLGQSIALSLVPDLNRSIDTFRQMVELYGVLGTLSPGGLLRFSLRAKQQKEALVLGAGIDDTREFRRSGVAREALPVIDTGTRAAATSTRALTGENDRLIKQYRDMLDAWNPLALRWDEDLGKVIEATADQTDQWVLMAEQVLGVDKALQDFNKSMEDAAGSDLVQKVEEVNDVARQLGMTFSSAFEDAILASKKFSKALKGLLDDIARVTLRKTITEPLAGAVSTGIGEIIKAVFPKRAGGGPVSAGQAYLVGERGPEPFIPNTSGYILPNGHGVGNVLNVSFNINALDPRSVTQVIAQQEPVILGMMQRAYNRIGRRGPLG